MLTVFRRILTVLGGAMAAMVVVALAVRLWVELAGWMAVVLFGGTDWGLDAAAAITLVGAILSVAVLIGMWMDGNLTPEKTPRAGKTKKGKNDV